MWAKSFLPRRSRLRSNSSERRLRKSRPKMNSLNSEASILPRRMSADLKRKLSSWERVIFSLVMKWRLAPPNAFLPSFWRPPYAFHDFTPRSVNLPARCSWEIWHEAIIRANAHFQTRRRVRQIQVVIHRLRFLWQRLINRVRWLAELRWCSIRLLPRLRSAI